MMILVRQCPTCGRAMVVRERWGIIARLWGAQVSRAARTVVARGFRFVLRLFSFHAENGK